MSIFDKTPVVNLDSVGFGNPCARDFSLIKKETYLDKLLPFLQKKTPPANSSTATLDELKLLVKYAGKVKEDENYLYDERLLQYISQLFIEAGADPEKVSLVADNVSIDALPLVTKLKFFFNRLRPAQLAYYLDIPLYPDFSFFVNSPSYPSCHVTLTYITCEVLGNHYPTAYEKALEIIKKVALSRLFLGVHYPSDNDMAMIVAKEVVKNPEFKARFAL